MTKEHYTYVIVGGGTAAAHAVSGIRAHDTTGTIALFGGESHLPYDRPPLSKGLWMGKTTPEDLPVQNAAYYEANNVRLYLGTRIEHVFIREKEVRDESENAYTYGKLLIATGGVPRPIQFGNGFVQYFRTIDDYQALLKAIQDGGPVLFIGGGFIGCELAAAITGRGNPVSMIFPDGFLLERVLPSDLADFVTSYYRSKGIELISRDIATGGTSEAGLARIMTRSGRTLSAATVLAAIGLRLNTRMASTAALAVGNGIIVDRFLRTSAESIYAAGDVTFFPSKALGKSVRIEHWDNARAQGKFAGENMAGAAIPFDYLPYFYSDLFDLGFEAVGEVDSRLETFADWKERFREGVVYYLEQNRVRGILLWNVWEKLEEARAIIMSGKVYNDTSELRGRI